MESLFMATCASALLAFSAKAQIAPGAPSEVANPGGQLPGNPQIALVKVADGFPDPINVANARAGDARAAIPHFVRATRIFVTPPWWIVAGEFGAYLDIGDHAAALTVADEWVERGPQPFRAHFLAMRRWDVPYIDPAIPERKYAVLRRLGIPDDPPSDG